GTRGTAPRFAFAGSCLGGVLDQTIRADLLTLVRNGKAETRLTRRANALLLLDGMSCEEIAKVLYLDDDWYELYSEKGLSWLADLGYKGRTCELTAAQQDALKTWVAQMLPRTTTMAWEWIEKSYGVSYTARRWSSSCSAMTWNIANPSWCLAS